jgi:hypothetical protein
MSQDLPLSGEVDHHLVVHHLIRLLGRRPTPDEVARFRPRPASPVASPRIATPSATSSSAEPSAPTPRLRLVPSPRPPSDNHQ